MDTISVKIPRELRLRLVAESKRRHVGQSAIIREALERALKSRSSRAQPESCGDLIGDLIGCLTSGRPDLATDESLLENAILEDAKRGTKRNR